MSLVTASPKPAAAHHAGTITVHKDAGSLPALSPHPGQAADADGHALAPVSSVITGTLLQAVLQGSYHYAPEENRHLASPTGLTVRREALDAAPGHRQQADSPQDSPSALDSGPSRYPNLPRHPPRPCDESPVQRRVSGESTGSVGSPRREWRDATAACSPGRGMCGAGAMPPLPRDAKRRHSLACAWEAEVRLPHSGRELARYVWAWRLACRPCCCKGLRALQFTHRRQLTSPPVRVSSRRASHSSLRLSPCSSPQAHPQQHTCRCPMSPLSTSWQRCGQTRWPITPAQQPGAGPQRWEARAGSRKAAPPKPPPISAHTRP